MAASYDGSPQSLARVEIWLDQVACEECARLTAEYNRRNQALTAAREAANAAFEAPAYQYRRLRAVSNEAWLDAETARLELERHRRGHRQAD